MPTPLSLGHSLVYHAASMPHRLVGRGERRPVIVIGGWLGAKPHQLKAYQRFYHDRGCDTLSFAVGPQHVLLPDRATALMERVLERCLAPTGNEARPPPAVAFHMFSVGGYCFGQMLRVLESRQRRFAAVPELISAQVFDSPPDIAGIAKGVSRSMGVGPPLSTVVEVGLSSYLAIAARTSVGRSHEAASMAFHGNTLQAPSLWFYSKADLVADWERIEQVQEKWRSRGIVTEQCRWDDSPHIQHGRVDPERYFGALGQFLERHGVV